MQVRIAEVAIGKVPLKDAFRQGTTSEDKLLMVKLELLNVNPTKKVEYLSWAGGGISFGGDDTTLKDNFGNTYTQVGFGFGTFPVGAVQRAESIYPNKAVTDVLVFQVPLEKATYLDLELPAQNYGAKGLVRFRIPMQGVRQATAKHEAERAAAQGQAAARVADLKAKLTAAQEEAGRAKQQAEQARQQAEQAARKAEQAYRIYMNSRGGSSNRDAVLAGSAEAASRIEDYQNNLQASQQAAQSKQEAESLVQKAQQAAAKARQADLSVAQARSALQQAERDRNQTPAVPK